MRILAYTFCSSATGYGHYYRSLALAQTAQQRGHAVTFASDRRPSPGLTYIPAVYNDPVTMARAIDAVKPDWVFVDIPHTPPGWIREMVKGKICTLNGIGYNQNDGADLRIIQGMANLELPGVQDKVPVLKGIEYVILRPELEQYQGRVKGKDTLVWGGGADVLGLLSRFPLACPDTFSTLIMADMTPPPLVNGPMHTTVKVQPDSLEMFDWMAASGRAVVAMGMCVFELAFLGIPTYAFNASQLHLRFALAAMEAGLIKTWPDVGLPDNREIRNFISDPFEPNADGLDLNGARRVMEIIEQYE